MRMWPSEEVTNRTSTRRARRRRPPFSTRSISVVCESRRARGKPSVESDAGVLAGQLDRQTLATLPATAAQRLPSPLCLHARAESVRPDATLVAGAVRGLTHLVLRNCERGADDDGGNVIPLRPSTAALS